jgi:hypothetical protein
MLLAASENNSVWTTYGKYTKDGLKELRMSHDDGRNLLSVLITKLAISVVAMPIVCVAEGTEGNATAN